MPIVGGERFPAVDGHTAQRTVRAVAKGLVSLGFADDLMVRFADAVQFEFVENVGHHVGTEGLHFRSGLTTNELLKMAIPQITFQGVATRDAQHRGVKQAVDDVEGWNFRGSPGIDEAG